MRRISLILIPVLTVFIIVMGLFWWNTATAPASNVADSQRFVVTRGSSAVQIGNKLSKEGLIKSSLGFKIYVQVTGKASGIKAGEFRLSPSMSLAETVEALSGGPVELWVTIPEGFRREQIAARAVSSLEMDSVQTTVFTDEFMIASDGMEGMLFPDTYLFARDVTAIEVVNVLNNTFEKKYSVLLDEFDSTYSKNQIVTMASLIERETISDEERSLVAGVLWKRFTNDWPLQVDASVQYVLGTERCAGIGDCDWWQPPTKADLDVDSSYNTYRSLGLPPAPIANPGESSLSAAMNPEPSEYWYYLHDKDGQIHFASTLEGHNSNVAKYIY